MIDLSTHVLDIELGEPARGVPVQLFSGSQQIASAVTGIDGRIAQLAHSLQPGTYRLTFDVSAYRGQRRHGGEPAPFLQRVSFEIAMTDDRHYHVPLLLSGYACTTYRGS